jgi:hypothetical protein
MKLAPTYLTRNQHGTVYFRMVIPAPPRPQVNGKRGIRRALKTVSKRLCRSARSVSAGAASALRPGCFDVTGEKPLLGAQRSARRACWSSQVTMPTM